MPGMYHIKLRGARIYICTNQGEYRLFNVAEPTTRPPEEIYPKRRRDSKPPKSTEHAPCYYT